MKIFLASLLLMVASATRAQQTPPAPRNEFIVALSETTLALKPGETGKVKVNVIRSKSLAKASVSLGVSSVLPPGMIVSFEPAEGYFESGVASITVDGTTPAGNYNLVLRGTIQYKTKGTILKISVANENVALK